MKGGLSRDAGHQETTSDIHQQLTEERNSICSTKLREIELLNAVDATTMRSIYVEVLSDYHAVGGH